jgi:hypothetical protein
MVTAEPAVCSQADLDARAIGVSPQGAFRPDLYRAGGCMTSRLPAPDASAARAESRKRLYKPEEDPGRTQAAVDVKSAASVMSLSSGKLILHLLGRAEAELAGRRNLDGLAGAWIATLTRRAVFDLELTKARQADLFAFLRGLDDAGKNRVDRLLGSTGVQTRGHRHVIDQFRSFQFARLHVNAEWQRPHTRPDVTRFGAKGACPSTSIRPNSA